MDDNDCPFIFKIVKHVKQFYESPVIFVTKRDYGDDVFNTLCKLKTLLMDNAPKETFMESIVEFHIQWLRSIYELEEFRKRTNNIKHEEVYQAISYTIDAIVNRLKYLNKYIDNMKSAIKPEDSRSLHIDLEIIEEMNKEVTHVLLEKLTCFRNFTGESEFQLKIKSSIDDLMDWIDKIYDELAIQFACALKLDVQMASDLTKCLKQIVDDLLSCAHLKATQKILEDLKLRGSDVSALVRCNAARNLEISKIKLKISSLEDRIKRLEIQNSSAVMALVNKKKVLEHRLEALENFRSTLQQVHNEDNDDEAMTDENCPCSYESHIFSHILPTEQRERLVTDLCYLWDRVLFGEKVRKSIISILSANDIKEEFIDEIGKFFVDKHGRKIYRKDNDSVLYQQNEHNDLVPLNDDEHQVYFFDECGRYYIDKNTSQRVYKAHGTASEYMMGSLGSLLKVKEERDGVSFYYDNYGRYYINEDGKHIYRDTDCISEYEHDGFGNLVRLRSHFDLFELCPDDSQISEDSKYLKESVGRALRESIASVILHQPADPIKYLSVQLKKYRENLEIKEKRAKNKEELLIERQIRAAEERAAAEQAALDAYRDDAVSEASYDSNLLNYETIPDNNTETQVTDND